MSHAEDLFDVAGARRTTLIAAFSSIGLAAVKITTGIAGNSYALIADGIESLTDVVASLAVMIGLTWSVKPPDERHPYGHGKLETFASLFVASCLVGAAGLIAWQSIHEILEPHEAPRWFTLPVLAIVIAIKIAVSRALNRSGVDHGSAAMEADAWHHLSDALTSAAAFIGISIALIGGPEWAEADDWAALVACGIILWNGLRLMWRGLHELLEAQAPQALEEELRAVASAVEGVRQIEKLRVRKSGMAHLMDIHIEVDGDISVRAGHDIAGAVKAALIDSGHRVVDVTVHVEPFGSQGEAAQL